MKICFISLISIALLIGCAEEKDSNTRQLERLELEIGELTKRLENLPDRKVGLTHLVFLDLKSDLLPEQLEGIMEKVNQLGEIANVQSFNIGRYQDVGDPRAMSQYEIVLELLFENAARLASYQQNEQHLAIRAELKKYLAGPPVVYDYLIHRE
ncbi:MAG: Dabb family protein [Calditrichia bacterium]